MRCKVGPRNGKEILLRINNESRTVLEHEARAIDEGRELQRSDHCQIAPQPLLASLEHHQREQGAKHDIHHEQQAHHIHAAVEFEIRGWIPQQVSRAAQRCHQCRADAKVDQER